MNLCDSCKKWSACASPNKDSFDGCAAFDGITRADLAARDAEIADLKRGGVVVPEIPELSEEPVVVEDFADNGAHSQWRLVDRSTGETLWEEATRPIPADRVLGEGDVKVSAKAIEQASKTLDSLVVTSWARGDHEEKMVTELCAAFRPIACAATCAQPTQAPANGIRHVHV